nr:uncharacterized protein LOC111989360 [Quercus suber]
MGNMKCTKKAKMILVPYPAQGHVTPMLKLASAFHNRRIFDTILITPEFIHHQIASSMEPKDQILCMPIPDGLDKDTPRDFFAIEMAMEKNMPVHLEAMIHKLVEDGEVVCVVVDLLASWAIEVANRCRVPVAGFWPVMFAAYQMIAAIPDMVRTGLVSDTGDIVDVPRVTISLAITLIDSFFQGGRHVSPPDCDSLEKAIDQYQDESSYNTSSTDSSDSSGGNSTDEEYVSDVPGFPIDVVQERLRERAVSGVQVGTSMSVLPSSPLDEEETVYSWQLVSIPKLTNKGLIILRSGVRFSMSLTPAKGANCRLIKSLASSDRNWKTKFIFVSGFWAGNPMDMAKDPFAPYAGT